MAKNLGIAYSVKNKKKMAKGGQVEVSASNESRPMPETKAADSKMVSENSNKKKLVDAQWDDSPTVKQAQKPSITPLSRPKMAESSIVRSKLRDQEEALIPSMPPSGYGKQPPKLYDEKDAKKQGPSVPALNMKMMADGGEVKDENPMKKRRVEAMGSRPDTGWGAIIVKAKGGMINKAVSMEDAEDDQVVHPDGLEETDSSMAPPEEEYMANHFAEGGDIDHEMMEQPEPEADEEKHASIAAAIMAKKAKMMADGGEVDIESNEEEQPNMYDKRNAAVLKEHYGDDLNEMSQPMDSNEHGDDIESDLHDMVSKIRSKMNMRRQFKGE